MLSTMQSESTETGRLVLWERVTLHSSRFEPSQPQRIIIKSGLTVLGRGNQKS